MTDEERNEAKAIILKHALKRCSVSTIDNGNGTYTHTMRLDQCSHGVEHIHICGLCVIDEVNNSYNE